MSKLLASPKAQAKFMLKHALAVVKEMKLEQLTRDRVKESVMLAVDKEPSIIRIVGLLPST